jgi:oxidoreductase, short chain dehydrogenase/reductase family
MGRAASYSASKAYQSTYIQALDQLAVGRQLHIRFTDIRPGFVDTPLLTGDHYPMLMQTTTVAKAALRAIFRGQRVCIIDWRYRLLVALWRMIPNRLWRSIRLGRTQ